eukprot:scaffold80481_cov30-Phaeocystis_antarctica.AAC.1
MGCALGHRSSSVRRTGTIYGGSDTSPRASGEVVLISAELARSRSNWSFSGAHLAGAMHRSSSVLRIATI